MMFTVAGLLAVTLTAPFGEVSVENRNDRLDVAVETLEGRPALVIRNERFPWHKDRGETLPDTEFTVTATRHFPVTPGKRFVVLATGRCNREKAIRCQPVPAVRWYDAKGKALMFRDAAGVERQCDFPFVIDYSNTGWERSHAYGIVPPDARFADFRIGGNEPDVRHHTYVALAELKYEEAPDSGDWQYADLDGPTIERVSASPCSDARAAIAFRIIDASGFDLGSLKCTIDGRDVTAKVRLVKDAGRSKDDLLVYEPDADWQMEQVVTVECTVKDQRGNVGTDRIYVAFTKAKTAHPKYTLRDDGFILKDGEPFFPVGPYSVQPRELHGNDIRQGVRALQAVGCNMVQTYLVDRWNKHKLDNVSPNPQFDELADECDRLGLALMSEPTYRRYWPAKGRDGHLFGNALRARARRCTFSPGTADDTSMQITVDDLRDDYRKLKAIDPDALTYEVDAVSTVGCHVPFAPYTDILVCEVYPYCTNPPKGTELADIERSLDIARGDFATAGVKSPCLMSVVQGFASEKSVWKHYPSYEELRAEAFVSIVCGMKGVQFYTYGSGNYENLTSNPRHFDDFAKVTRELSGMMGDLTARDAEDQPKVEILAGPRTTAYGRCSVRALLKSTGLLIAVNLAPQPVRVKLGVNGYNSFERDLSVNGVLVGKLADLTTRDGPPEVRTVQPEDPLVFADGTKVKTVSDWRRRRGEILELFQREMYGRMPPKPEALVTELLDERETCSTFATRRRLRMWFRADKSGPFVDWLVLRPKNAAKPCPPIVFLNSLGDFQLLPDEDLGAADGFICEEDKPSESRAKIPLRKGQRGIWCNPNNRYHCPIAVLLARGFAVVTACYYDIAPDPGPKDRRATHWRRRCFELWPETIGRDDDTRALMAWAWGLCRGLDLAEREPGIDASRAIVTGCSRLGKAALIAGAFDERFQVVVPNQTGKGGAPLTRRMYGENIGTESQSFPHWFTPRYLAYAKRDTELPYDQHLLMACVAPRALLIEGFDAPWFDTKGEFLAVKAASPVWKFLGKSGLPDVDWPDDFSTSAIGRDLGYVRRNGPHGLWAYDWVWLMDFALGNLSGGLSR